MGGKRLKQLERILTRLPRQQFCYKSAQMRMGGQSSWLGCWLTPSGLNHGKIEAILNLPTSSKCKEVRAFIGTTFYRDMFSIAHTY
jgi:hypothetical protein